MASMNIRIFKVGQRVQLRGLVMQGTGTIIKIGRARATVQLDTPLRDLRMNKFQEQKTLPTFEYKHLRILDNLVTRIEVHDIP